MWETEWEGMQEVIEAFYIPIVAVVKRVYTFVKAHPTAHFEWVWFLCKLLLNEFV